MGVEHDIDPLASFMSLILEIAKENKEFLEKHVRNLLEESLWLINDAIDYICIFIRGGHEKVIKSTMAFYVLHILEPVSYSIFINLLLGNVPVCFRDLRFLVESLAKCYLAEIKYSDVTFFKKKLDKLMNEKNEKGKRKREYEFVKEFDAFIGSKAIKLWGKLSEEVHTKKYVDRILEAVTSRSTRPPYALGIPMRYYESDLVDLNDLCNYIYEFREILKRGIGHIVLKDLVERHKDAYEDIEKLFGDVGKTAMELLKDELKEELDELESKFDDIPLDDYLNALVVELKFEGYHELAEVFKQVLSERMMA